jgi:hypothetical protein
MKETTKAPATARRHEKESLALLNAAEPSLGEPTTVVPIMSRTSTKISKVLKGESKIEDLK